MIRPTTVVTAAIFLALVAACGGDDDEAEPSSSYTATISEAGGFAIGPVRFAFLLEDARGEPVTNASVHLRFFYVDPVRDDRETLKNDINATQVELEGEYALDLPDGSTVSLGPGPTGVFANNIAFDQAGDWIVEMTGTAGNNNLGTIEASFAVADSAAGPRTGQAAPDLDGAPPQGPAMIIFGDRGECETDVCGPLVEISEVVAGDHAAEIAVQSLPLEFGVSWGVGDAPAVFFVDSDGFVRGHVHTIASEAEVEALAQSLLP